MSETIGLMALDTVVNPYLDAELRSNASQDAAAKVEREMKQLISNAYESAMKTLRENAGMLNKLAEYLLMHENITGDEFMQILKEEQQTAAAEITEE
jgi:cell division protease FtsH